MDPCSSNLCCSSVNCIDIVCCNCTVLLVLTVFWQSLEFSIYNIMSLANIEFHFFLSDLDAFSFSYLITLARTSKSMFNKSGKSSILSLFLILEEKSFQLFTIEYVSCGLIIYGPYYVEVCIPQHNTSKPTIPSFYHKWMLNFVRCFFCIY